jgi:hypothetical protein
MAARPCFQTCLQQLQQCYLYNNYLLYDCLVFGCYVTVLVVTVDFGVVHFKSKLGDPAGSILGRTSTQGLKITEEKVLPLH